MASSFARDMRAIRRERQTHWRAHRQGDRAPETEAVVAVYDAAVERFKTEPRASDPEARAQDWAFSMSAALDGAGVELPAAARSFLESRPLPDTTKSTRRLVRRVRRDYLPEQGAVPTP